MASCKFELRLTKEPESLFARAKKAVEYYNVQFDGDINGGRFSLDIWAGSIEGFYSFNNEMLTVNLTKKPILLPCKVIEEFLKAEINK